MIVTKYSCQPAIHLLAIRCTVVNAPFCSTSLIVAWHDMFCPTSSFFLFYFDRWHVQSCYMMYLSKLPIVTKIYNFLQFLYYNFLRISSSTSHTPPGYLWHCVVFLMVDCCMTWYVLSYFFLFHRRHVQSLLHHDVLVEAIVTQF